MTTGFSRGEFETEFLQELAYGLVFYSIFSNNLEDGIMMIICEYSLEKIGEEDPIITIFQL